MSRKATLVYPPGMVERHPVRHASAAVVPADMPFGMTEGRHHLDLIVRHRPERISGVIRPPIGLRAVAITAQIRRDHGELLGEARRDLVPHHVRQRVAVQQQQRRTGAAVAQVDPRAGSFDLCVREAFEHGCGSRGGLLRQSLRERCRRGARSHVRRPAAV